MPRFSIVVPAYNAEDTLAETLDAVLAQAYDDWECVVVDDGSTDGTATLAQAYEQKDPRFRVISQNNRGTGGAYNTGVGWATGDWVSICSADDVLLPEHLGHMSRAIDENPGYDIYSCNGYFWHTDGSRELVYTDEDATRRRSWSLEETFRACFFSVGACYRRSIFQEVGGYREDVFGEDYDFWLRAMACGAKHLYVPEALALHRKSATQKSANLKRAYESDIRSITSALDSGQLDPGQAQAASSAIRHRKILILELGHVAGPIIRALRRTRSIVTNRVERAKLAAMRRIAPSPAQAKLVTWMARTGVGTDACLEQGSLPLPVHFYSPVPDLDDLKRRNAWARRSDLPGVDFRPEAQVAYLLELGKKYGRECGWPAEPTADPSEFHTENNSFSFGCAAAAHCIIRDRRPRRLIEIGSGRSSLVLSAALDLNERDGMQPADYTVVDPYPSPLLETLPGTRPSVVAERVELVDPGLFEQLESGDALFIDSGHVVRIAGDVNFLVLDVLPRLKRGVVVHFHDIHLPYEYPEVYATNAAFRMLWTEGYMLQAFLACNSEFEVLLGMKYLMQDRPDVFRQAFPLFDPARHKSMSGSFWIARC